MTRSAFLEEEDVYLKHNRKGIIMAYYPLFFDFTDQPILIVGGGKVAFEKAKRLLKTKAQIEIIAPEIQDNVLDLPLTCTQRSWKAEDVANKRLVIAATNDLELNQSISKACQEAHVLCNVVDNAKLSDVIFGAVAFKDNISVGVSTSGASPKAAQDIRNVIDQEILNDSLIQIVDWLGSQRKFLKQEIEPSLHSKAFKELWMACQAKGQPLSHQEYALFLKKYRRIDSIEFEDSVKLEPIYEV